MDDAFEREAILAFWKITLELLEVLMNSTSSKQVKTGLAAVVLVCSIFGVIGSAHMDGHPGSFLVNLVAFVSGLLTIVPAALDPSHVTTSGPNDQFTKIGLLVFLLTISAPAVYAIYIGTLLLYWSLIGLVAVFWFLYFRSS